VTYHKYAQSGFATPSRRVECWSERFRQANQGALPGFVPPCESPATHPDLLPKYRLSGTTRRVAEYVHTKLVNLPTPGRVYPDPLAANPRVRRPNPGDPIRRHCRGGICAGPHSGQGPGYCQYPARLGVRSISAGEIRLIAGPASIVFLPTASGTRFPVGIPTDCFSASKPGALKTDFGVDQAGLSIRRGFLLVENCALTREAKIPPKLRAAAIAMAILTPLSSAG